MGTGQPSLTIQLEARCEPELTRPVKMLARWLDGVQRHFDHLDERRSGFNDAQRPFGVHDYGAITLIAGAIIGRKPRVALVTGKTTRRFVLPLAAFATD